MSPTTDPSPAPDPAQTADPPGSSGHTQSDDRIEQFTSEIADMHLSGAAGGRDRTLLRVGVATMVIGVIVAIVAYFISHGTTNALQQRDALVIAVIGLTLTVVGAALFIRYSLAQFLRFWMARLSFDSSTGTDRLVDALRNRD